MEFGGTWCPNQQAAGLPTRANDRGKKARRKGREKADISVASPSNVKIAREPFIVNMMESIDAGSATTAMLSAELNRRLSQKSIPLLPNWRN
jgi:hypothetical protein